MERFVIVQRDPRARARYLAQRGKQNTFTSKLEQARCFSSYAGAKAETCPGSEYVMNVDALLPTPEH